MKMTWSRAALLVLGSRRLTGGSARRRGVLVVLAAGAAVLCAGLLTGAGAASAAGVRAGAGARAAASAVRWGRAEEVPGLGALNTGGNAHAVSVSCWSAGNCAAGGYYTRRLGYRQAFVVSQRNGRWGKALEVPATAVLNKGGNAQVAAVSCAPGGYCAAGGYYTDRGGHQQPLIVTLAKGRWGKGTVVPGLAALNTSGGAQVSSVSCPSAGNCAAGGSYTAVSGGQGFVVSETKYRWHVAVEVPGLAALNVGGNAAVSSLSCWSAGNCAAGGSYQSSTSPSPYTGSPPVQAFVVSERNGAWHAAEEVPGTAALNSAGDAQTSSVSCAPGGYCAAGGYLEFASEDGPYPSPFVVSAKNGRWGTAEIPPSTKALNGGFDAPIAAVSCPSAGSCAAAGYEWEPFPGGHWQAFVVSQKNGVWDVAEALPGTGAENQLTSLSCSSAGNCGASLYDVNPTRATYVAGERDGHWAKAEQVPGTAALDKGGVTVVSWVSCPSAGNCVAVGSYTDGHRRVQAFVGGA